MADRKSFPFRFWTSNQRRVTPRPAASAPQSVSARTPAPKVEAPTNSQPTTSPASSSAASFKTPSTSEPENQESGTSTITNEPTTPPTREVQTAIQSTEDANPTNFVVEPQNSSLSRSTSQSRALSQPASPSRRTSQSRTPPQPLSPSRVSPKARSPVSSPPPTASQMPSTPQKKPVPRSPSSRSPKLASSPSINRVQPNSPSKESKRSSSKSNTSSIIPNDEEPKPASYQQEPIELQQPANVKNDFFHDSSSLSTDERNITHNEMEVAPLILSNAGTKTTTPAEHRKPSEPSQNLDTIDLNDEREPISGSSVNPEETKEVKVVTEQVMKTDDMDETEKEINGFLAPKSGSEAHTTMNIDTGTDSNPMHVEKEELKQDRTFGKDEQSAQPRGENVPLHKEIRGNLSTFVNKMAIGDQKNGVHDKPVSVITLAGENRGASMHLGPDSSRTEGPIHIHRSYKIEGNESPDTTTDLESHSKNAKIMDSPRILEDQPAEAYVNNNAQSINNSLVFNCSISERNPGVHMVFANIPKEYIESGDKIKTTNVQKAEFSATTAEKVMHKPRIRRRCLQGLFLESSDSETEDTENPRRHGCRVGCKTRGDDDRIDVR
ncbi:uncharacterized protein [Henckelia pumila]|uniref:uncharacterized protein isoform X2 n=1 Tax=Henckelia pumila TaxID=405737 RepID=UPI003C6E7DBE